jgi:hypothetical protein
VVTDSFGPGNSGLISIVAGQITLQNGANVLAQSSGSGSGGKLVVSIAGSLTVDSGASLGTVAFADGNAGDVSISVAGPITMEGSGSRIATNVNSGSRGNAGSVAVTASQIAITSGAEIATTTGGTGAGGSVTVATRGTLELDGTGSANTGIVTSAIGAQSGPGGSVRVAADALTINGGAQIASSIAGTGKGGDVTVRVANAATLSGVGPGGASGVTTSTQPASVGEAGEVMLTAGDAIALSGGAAVTSTTAGAGNGGTVQVRAQGPLTLADVGTRISSSTQPGSSGNAGSVVVAAPQITIGSGAEIASTTAGTGAGGSVSITTSGALALASIADKTIAVSALGSQFGLGGSVVVQANVLTIGDAAQIAIADARTVIAGVVANGAMTSGSGLSAASTVTGLAGQVGDIELKVGGAVKAASDTEAGNSDRTAVPRETCETRANQPISNLVAAGRGGLPQDPEAVLPALYIAGSDINPNLQPGKDTVDLDSAPILAAAQLKMPCD